MPKIGKKRKLLVALDQLFLFRLSQSIIDIPNLETIQSYTSEYIASIEMVNYARYASDRIQIRKSKKWYYSILPSLRGGRFRQQLRMNKIAFHHVASVLSGTPEFQGISENSLRLQMTVAFFRFGRSGNGCSIMDVSSRFGVSEGSVHAYTRRVIRALNRLRPEVIKWPNDEEMRKISNRFTKVGFPGCFGLVDGTSVPFYDKPLDMPEDYYSRKQEYAMQLQLITDDNKRIIHMYTGMPASVHDSTVFRHSRVNIPNGHYIIGDSAYPNSDTIVTPFRKRVGNRPAREATFNRHLSSVRVAVEHAIGILKNRFQSLKGLRVRIDRENGHRRACEWISACCILYNIICECEPWDEKENPDVDDDEDQQQPVNQETGRRTILMHNIWNLKTAGVI